MNYKKISLLIIVVTVGITVSVTGIKTSEFRKVEKKPASYDREFMYKFHNSKKNQKTIYQDEINPSILKIENCLSSFTLNNKLYQVDASVALKVSEKSSEILLDNAIVVKDIVLRELSTSNGSSFNDVERLKKRIRMSINKHLDSNGVEEVYFEKFLIR